MLDRVGVDAGAAVVRMLLALTVLTNMLMKATA